MFRLASQGILHAHWFNQTGSASGKHKSTYRTVEKYRTIAMTTFCVDLSDCCSRNSSRSCRSIKELKLNCYFIYIINMELRERIHDGRYALPTEHVPKKGREAVHRASRVLPDLSIKFICLKFKNLQS